MLINPPPPPDCPSVSARRKWRVAQQWLGMLQQTPPTPPVTLPVSRAHTPLELYLPDTSSQWQRPLACACISPHTCVWGGDSFDQAGFIDNHTMLPSVWQSAHHLSATLSSRILHLLSTQDTWNNSCFVFIFSISWRLDVLSHGERGTWAARLHGEEALLKLQP